MTTTTERRRQNRHGQGLVEYFLILVLVGIAGIMTTEKVGKETVRLYDDATGKVTAAVN